MLPDIINHHSHCRLDAFGELSASQQEPTQAHLINSEKSPTLSRWYILWPRGRASANKQACVRPVFHGGDSRRISLLRPTMLAACDRTRHAPAHHSGQPHVLGKWLVCSLNSSLMSSLEAGHVSANPPETCIVIGPFPQVSCATKTTCAKAGHQCGSWSAGWGSVQYGPLIDADQPSSSRVCFRGMPMFGSTTPARYLSASLLQVHWADGIGSRGGLLCACIRQSDH